MKISIAMCTYNGAEYLKEQLDSIIAQTLHPDELVICDDCSFDNTLEIIKHFASIAPFSVRFYINSKNLRSTKNFEKAISLCEGDIIVLSDQDDVWNRDKLERLKRTFLDLPHVGAVFSDAEIVDQDLNPFGYSLWESVGFNEHQQKLVTKGRAIEVLLKYNIVTGATMAFRSKLRNYFIPIPNIWVHDGWISLIIASIVDMAIIKEPLIKYRQHQGQQIGALMKSKNFKDQLATAKKTKSNYYIGILQQYEIAYERILSISKTLNFKNVIPMFESKKKHLLARGNMPNSILRRVPIVIKELVNLRYHRYSNGGKSFAKDLFFKN